VRQGVGSLRDIVAMARVFTWETKPSEWQAIRRGPVAGTAPTKLSSCFRRSVSNRNGRCAG
jgi:hypothetical protein